MALAAVLASALFVPAATTGSGTTKATYLVVYSQGASLSEARAEVKRLGGTILREDQALGYAKVTTATARNRIVATATRGTARRTTTSRGPPKRGRRASGRAE